MNVFRGVTLPDSVIDIYQEGEIINLSGYASTSKKYNTALEFAFNKNKPDDKKSVVFNIDLQDGTLVGFCF